VGADQVRERDEGQASQRRDRGRGDDHHVHDPGDGS
jgi:hypothetical protein